MKGSHGPGMSRRKRDEAGKTGKTGGMHKMPDGHMMSDAEMKRMMGGGTKKKGAKKGSKMY